MRVVLSWTIGIILGLACGYFSNIISFELLKSVNIQSVSELIGVGVGIYTALHFGFKFYRWHEKKYW